TDDGSRRADMGPGADPAAAGAARGRDLDRLLGAGRRFRALDRLHHAAGLGRADGGFATPTDPFSSLSRKNLSVDDAGAGPDGERQVRIVHITAARRAGQGSTFGGLERFFEEIIPAQRALGLEVGVLEVAAEALSAAADAISRHDWIGVSE